LDEGDIPSRSTKFKIMKGYIVLYKVNDKDAVAFEDLLKKGTISPLGTVEGYYGGDDYESNANAFFHEL